MVGESLTEPRARERSRALNRRCVWSRVRSQLTRQHWGRYGMRSLDIRFESYFEADLLDHECSGCSPSAAGGSRVDGRGMCSRLRPTGTSTTYLSTSPAPRQGNRIRRRSSGDGRTSSTTATDASRTPASHLQPPADHRASTSHSRAQLAIFVAASQPSLISAHVANLTPSLPARVLCIFMMCGTWGRLRSVSAGTERGR